jgi:hypothetical protein
MLKIRKAQREAFEARDAVTFPRRVRALLRENLPEKRAQLDGPAGLAAVEEAIADARGKGFLGERDACQFVALRFVLGAGFDAEPWAATVLSDESLTTPTDRIEALWDAAKRRELGEAAADVAAAMKG